MIHISKMIILKVPLRREKSFALPALILECLCYFCFLISFPSCLLIRVNLTFVSFFLVNLEILEIIKKTRTGRAELQSA